MNNVDTSTAQSAPQINETQAISSIAVIYAFRFVGLFMLVPILSLYAHSLKNATPFLIGIALGCYGLTQAIFQIPFGVLSDKYGRKKLIYLGLLLFCLGSIVAALSPDIWGLILGRSLQGSGAVGSVTVALLADLTSEKERTKAMAVIGMTIGAAFSLAMVLGPLLNSWFSVPTIFWITLVFGLLALTVLKMWVPSPAFSSKPISQPQKIRNILSETKLLYFNFGILILHAVLTANFVVLPFIFQNKMGIPSHDQWKIYLPSLILAFFTLAPLLRKLRNRQESQRFYLIAIGLLFLAEFLLWQFQHFALQAILNLWIFFTAFTLLEAIIPSSISQIASVEYRGAALGVNSTFQFLGIFIGGAIGGWILDFSQINTVLIVCCALVFIWGIVALLGKKLIFKFN